MAYTYKGTKITGTSTSAKVFKKSGVKNAKANQTYLNTQKGHVYRCAHGGKPSEATWRYIETAIIAKPTVAVSSLCAPARRGSGSDTYDVSWKVPASLTKDKSGKRATAINILFRIALEAKKTLTYTVGDKSTSTKAAAINLSNFKIGGTTYTRNSFYPGNNGTAPKLLSLTGEVRGKNAKGVGKLAAMTSTFLTPRAPSITEPAISAQNGTVSVTIATDAGNDLRERHDTRYIITVENTRTGETFEHVNTADASTSIAASYDALDYQQLSYDEYIRVTFEAWARGYAGDSAHVTDSYTVAYPGQVTIEHVDVSSREASGKATFTINTNSSDDHPVDQVRLEYLANTTYKKANEIPGDASWTPTDIVDDAECNALAMPVQNLIPDPGKRTWVRVKSYHGVEAILYRYSEPVAVTDLETPVATAADDEVKIIGAASGEDGRSAELLLVWNADGQDDSTGTELSWSDDAKAWRSTKAPSTFDFTYSDGEYTHEGTLYHDSATITVDGLEEGEVTYIRARRYLDGDTTTFGEYSDMVAVMPSVAPSDVVLMVPTFTAAGDDIPLEWTFSGGGTQRAWQLVTDDGTIIANGANAVGSYSLSAERAAALAVDNTLTLRIDVATGGAFVSSDYYAITIAQPPTAAMVVPANLTAQPLQFVVEATTECELAVVVTSNGVDGETPTGVRLQPSGDTVYSGVIRPEWTATNDGVEATVTLPTGLDFIDNGSYTVRVVATDPVTGLSAFAVTGTTKVIWANQAVAPEDAVTVTPEDVTDDEGMRHQRVTITLTKPEGANDSDVYDLYRVTGDGAQLIGSGFPLVHSVIDEYAPFGDGLTLEYRAAIRTVDGDTAYSDIEYTADGDVLRFDWALGWLELPFDINIADAYAKKSEIRSHLTGEETAHYNQGVSRTAKLSSRLIRLDSQEQIDAARALARYPGTAFVRTPDGSAYEADVQIDDMSTPGVLQAVSITAREVATSSAFMLPSPVTEEEE